VQAAQPPRGRSGQGHEEEERAQARAVPDERGVSGELGRADLSGMMGVGRTQVVCCGVELYSCSCLAM